MLTFDSPKEQSSIIKVLGVGGGGGNAVNHMFIQGIQGVDFILCNTDAQALDNSAIPTKLQLGNSLTEGRGAGSKPEIGRNAAIEDLEKIQEVLSSNTKMLFITAGMGGGTGTGAAPVIAKVAHEMDILTVGIVTIPFGFEGRKRKQLAMAGIEEMKKYVDTILIISNEKLRELHGDLVLSEAFGKADNILATAAKGIAEIITVTGYINVDFEDVKTVMKNSGVAIMGAGIAEGENRAVEAAEMALNSPLLNDNDIHGSNNMLLYIATGTENEISMDEISEITDYIVDQAGEQCEVIWGSGTEEALGKKISVTLIATGFDSNEEAVSETKTAGKVVVNLHDESPANNTSNDHAQQASTNTINKISEPIIIKKKEPVPEKQIHFNIHETEKDEASQSGNIGAQEITEPTIIIKSANKEEKSSSEFDAATTPREISREHTTPPKLRDDRERIATERRAKLREKSYTIPKGKSIKEMEDVPAYKRKNVHISHTVVSKESDVSRYSLSEIDGNTDIKTNNSYLHDNID